MKRLKYIQDITVRPRSRNHISIFSAVLLTLSLGLGSVLSSGCVAIPAVMLTTTAVTAGALLSEGERLVQYPDGGSSAIVRNDSDGESACRQTCQRHEAPPDEDPT